MYFPSWKIQAHLCRMLRFDGLGDRAGTGMLSTFSAYDF